MSPDSDPPFLAWEAKPFRKKVSAEFLLWYYFFWSSGLWASPQNQTLWPPQFKRPTPPLFWWSTPAEQTTPKLCGLIQPPCCYLSPFCGLTRLGWEVLLLVSLGSLMVLESECSWGQCQLQTELGCHNSSASLPLHGVPGLLLSMWSPQQGGWISYKWLGGSQELSF